MKTKRNILACLSLALLLCGTGAFAEVIPFELEFGYRWTDVNGNEDLYRTQINEDDGFLVRAFTMNTQGEGLFEHVRIDASDIGTGPASALRVDAGKSGLYRFRLGYRRTEAYSALPTLANPFLNRGIIPGQHTFDRTRDLLDIDLELLQWSRFTPFVGFASSRYEGPGETTYTIGGDDFRLSQDLDEEDQEIRAGVGFNFGSFYGQVMQGWRNFDRSESLTLATGAGSGNNTNPVLGRPISATEITRRSEMDGSAPFTNLYFVAQPMSRFKVIGNFVRMTAEADGPESESAAGSFVSFGLGRFFGGLDEEVVSDAETDIARGGIRAEVGITDAIDIFAGFQSEDRDLSGTALISSLYLDTITFGGANPGDLEEILRTESTLDRSEEVISAGIAARRLGPLSLRAEFSRRQQGVTLAPDLAEIVVAGGQGGSFDRDVDSIDLSANFAMNGFTFGAALRQDDADESVLRTDYLDRDRVRLRAGYRTPGEFLRLAVTAERLDQENDRADVGFDGRMENLTADVEIAPLTMLRLRGMYSQFDADSSVIILRPETLNPVPSIHSEQGEAVGGGLSLIYPNFLFDADLALFENEGSYPFEVDRYRLRAAYDFTAMYGLAVEWARDDYTDLLVNNADFDADRFGVFLRLRR